MCSRWRCTDSCRLSGQPERSSQRIKMWLDLFLQEEFRGHLTNSMCELLQNRLLFKCAQSGRRLISKYL